MQNLPLSFSLLLGLLLSDLSEEPAYVIKPTCFPSAFQVRDLLQRESYFGDICCMEVLPGIKPFL